MSTGRNWTEAELIRTLSLYHQIPFGRMHRSAREVVQLAEWLGRTPSSVAMKLTNFASFDPEHKKRGVGGLGNASALDRQVWDRYATDWSTLAAELELPAEGEPPAVPPPPPPEADRPTSAERVVSVRVGQAFFRRAVLAAYESRCCITGLAAPQLLRASHIIPWGDREDTRLNPANGLCLNALHDAAFDRGLMTLDEDMRVVYSPRLWEFDHGDAAAAMLRQFEGGRVADATRHGERGQFLGHHRGAVFQRG